ncbi:MAG: polysaccharide biosynthesis tyrosine autokinase [Tannerella sp.]|jgi:capsular exopolysaccharide synthesis family protein|nr:polysaccharide biosynthesis tyrosine autokinase [Tannerella sp.]
MDLQNKSANHFSSDEKTVNILDIFMYLLSHWKWILLSLFIFGNYYGCKYSKTPFIYSRSITIMVKTPANTQSTMRLNRYNSFSMPVNVSSEMLQFKSKELMRRVIDILQADMSYEVREKLRPYELYTRSPIKIAFPDANPDDYHAITVIPRSERHVEISGINGAKDKEKISVNLNDTIQTQIGPIVVIPSVYYHANWYGKTIKVTKYARESMVNTFLSSLQTRQLEEDAAIMLINLTDKSTQRAADVLNTLVTVYNEEAVKDKNSAAIAAAEFIDSRLEIIESDLGNIETDIEKLRNENEGLDITMAASMYVSASREHAATLRGLESQLSLVRLMKQFLQDVSSNDLLPANTGFVDVNIENQIAQHNNVVLRRNRLVESGNSDQNPIVQETNRSIRAMRQNIIRAVDNAISSLNILRQTAAGQEALALSKISTIPEKQRVMLGVERTQKIKEELYLFLLNKREENLLNQAMVDDNARIVDPASGSNSHIFPSLYKNALLGAAFGFSVPVAILLLILMLDTRIHNRKEIESAVSIPFLGEIPVDSQISNQQVCISGQGFGMMTEAFRILRTNMQYMFRGKESKVISTISFFPGAGKTFIATNLAVSLVQINRRGILLDLDLRKGTMSANFKKDKKLGIVHYLSDDSIVLEDIINVNAVCENLDLISIGAIAPNPTELLLGNRLDELIIELKKRYDFIILDSAPIALVADASVVNRITDVNIFIIRAGKFDRRLLPDLESQYLQKKWTNLGVILNAVKKENRGYNYGYGYGYGYGNEKK